MVVEYGTVVPKGRLPVFSTCCEDRAEQLIVLACGMNYDGEYVARELVEEQTLDNLEAFSTRLDEAHDMMRPCKCNQNS